VEISIWNGHEHDSVILEPHQEARVAEARRRHPSLPFPLIDESALLSRRAFRRSLRAWVRILSGTPERSRSDAPLAVLSRHGHRVVGAAVRSLISNLRAAPRRWTAQLVALESAISAVNASRVRLKPAEEHERSPGQTVTRSPLRPCAPPVILPGVYGRRRIDAIAA
jgi:hypothetical protein